MLHQEMQATQRDLILIEKLSKSLEEDNRNMYELFNYQGCVKYDH